MARGEGFADALERWYQARRRLDDYQRPGWERDDWGRAAELQTEIKRANRDLEESVRLLCAGKRANSARS